MQAPRPAGDMEVFALRIKGRARERHPILPAVQPAQGKLAVLMGHKPITVSGRPDKALFIGWL